MAKLKSLTINDTGSLQFPDGTTAQQPSASVVVDTFSTVGTTSWTAPAGVTSVELLVVAGGGGGGSANGGYGEGGGGGGGVIYEKSYKVTPGSTYSVTVGAGGSGGASSGGTAPNNGGNSVFGRLTAFGGGRGANGTSDSAFGTAGAGGSGGGGSAGPGSSITYDPNAQFVDPGALGTPGQGHRGGAGGNTQSAAGYWGGAGGGAGAPGGDWNESGNPQRGPKGGDGFLCNISGTPTYYGGGGGGGAIWSSWTYSMDGGAGGLGGGGKGGGIAGGSNSQIVATNGTSGLGGGGGGGAYQSNGGTGGSGIVIVKYSLDTDTENPEGQVRFNTELGRLETYKNNQWVTDPIDEGIVTNGLMFWVDGANYRGTGSTWQDISGNGYAGTLVGSPTHNTANGGYFTFNGTDQYVDTNFDEDLSDGFTLEFLFRGENNSTTQFIASQHVSADANSDWRIERNNFGGANSGSVEFGTAVAGGGLSTASEIRSLAFPNLQWHHCTLVYDRQLLQKVTYRNGHHDTSEYNAPVLGHSAGATVRLAARMDVSRLPFKGDIAFFRIYNRPLSDSEVKQNYKAIKQRVPQLPAISTLEDLPVVEAGLKCHLDASHKGSYKGWGRKWYDLSGNNNHGTLSGNYSNNLGGPTWTPLYGGSLFFETLSPAGPCYVDLPTSTIITGTESYTVEVWFDNVIATSGELFGNYGPSYTANTLWIFAGGSYISGSNYIPNTGPDRYGGVHQIVATRGRYGYDVNVWRDAVHEVRQAANTNTINAGQNFRIGADVNATSTEQFGGHILKVLVYDRVLDPHEIQQNYQSFRHRVNNYNTPNYGTDT